MVYISIHIHLCAISKHISYYYKEILLLTHHLTPAIRQVIFNL